jgi:formylglycine-generating enzyme required for sulfatase activity
MRLLNTIVDKARALLGKVLPSAGPHPASRIWRPRRSNAPGSVDGDTVDSDSRVKTSAPRSAPSLVGKRFRDFDGAPEMIVVPAGTFLMGAPRGESDSEHERPQHRVSIARPFAVGVGPVTRGEFAAFVKATKPVLRSGRYSWLHPGFEQYEDHPVVCVNWHDAKAYVAWLNDQSHKEYRLLSEAEWEYCCRAGTTTAYNFGNAITREQANFGESFKVTTSFSKFPPNAFGLHDMHGNVWEWCGDHWRDSYGGDPPADGSAWVNDVTELRVLRGGSSSSNPQNLRSACRSRDLPDIRDQDIGFRVARTV